MTIDSVLPWTPLPEDDKRFQRILRLVLIVFLLLSLLIPWLPTLQREAEEIEDRPRPVASLLLEPPAPRSEVHVTEPEPAVPAGESEQHAEPQQRAPAAAQAPREATTAAPAPSARERAERSGVLALRDRLNDLRTHRPSSVLQEREQSGDGAASRNREERLTAADAQTGSGGIDSSEISRDTGGITLAGRGTERVVSPVGGGGGGEGGSGSRRDHRSTRTDEEIQLVFDRDKSSIYALYNRALRQDPTLRGQVVVRLTIAPSGEVTAAQVVSSELKNEELERRLLARIRQLHFGAKDVETISINYPIDFFPS